MASTDSGSASTAKSADVVFTGDDYDVRLIDWNQRVLPWVTVAALAPFIGFSRGTGVHTWIIIAIDVASWLVFLVDLIVRRRLVPRYLESLWGRVDLLIVVATFPWYLLVTGGGRWVVVFRFARLARLVMIAARLPTARLLIKRLDRLAVGALLLLLGCSYVALVADGPADNFDNFGDALWWGIVTMTTTGYGDIVPDTTAGRIAATVLMLGGLILLGGLAAIVSSFLTAGDRASEASARGDLAPQSGDGGGGGVQDELAALRAELVALRRAVDPSGASEPPAPQPTTPEP